MFNIKFTDSAIEDLQVFAKFEQKQIVSAIESALSVDAAAETDDRQRLNPNGPAEWAIRLGQVRVFYDVDIDNRMVKIEAIGKAFFV